ncbi:hypothetical protein FUAX_35050 [Fulvitalea axinellae]|uniref:FCP1 homology domain-containing protein n=1 Tax=Fulvitalea axinellae TaxID=1182444 RepID=A0AAU9CSG9_9BACT|nr:hypothetical protein FUAX_35050 [Fulvitalea axinellae]
MDTTPITDLLLILDIDETLVYATPDPLGRPEDFRVGPYRVYKRPGLEAFLDFAFRYFRVAVWSSASDAYVEEMVKKLGMEGKLEFAWGRSRATLRNALPSYLESDMLFGNLGHQHYIKRLKKVKKLGFSLDKTLMVDDSPHKLQQNYGNAIIVSEFTGDELDDELRLLARYLMSFQGCENVRCIEKRYWNVV